MNDMNNQLAEISTQEFGMDFISGLTEKTLMYTSLNPKDDKEKAAAFNAMNNTQHRLADFINKKIKVTDIFCEVLTMTREDPKTGEVVEQKAPRIVFIDEKGEGYGCVSIGIYGALKKMIAAYGQPTWKPGITIEVKQVNRAEKQMLTFDVIA